MGDGLEKGAPVGGIRGETRPKSGSGSASGEARGSYDESGEYGSRLRTAPTKRRRRPRAE
jgi:hypothetical protein